ncbi:MAG: aldo/keto reductase [Cyclobacteriaceae bacterium]
MEGVNSKIPAISLTKDFEISRIIKGGWQLSSGHRDQLNTDPVQDMISYAEAGITTFDCADIYTGVEQLIGKFLNEWKRLHSEIRPIRVLTKFVPDADALATLDKSYVSRIIERSLKRLGTERLDMVQFSWWDYHIDRYAEAAGWLCDLQKEGKIELISATNFNTEATAKILKAGVPLKTIQLQYSLLDSRPEKGLVDLCKQNEIKLLCYGTVAGGFISSKWLGKPEPQGAFENRSLVKYKLMIDETGGWERFQNLLETLSRIAEKHNVTITNVAGNYILSRPAVGSLIIGAATTNHLEENLRTFQFRLDESDLQQIETAKAALKTPQGDVWDLERIKEGPHGRIMRYNLNAQATDN